MITTCVYFVLYILLITLVNADDALFGKNSNSIAQSFVVNRTDKVLSLLQQGSQASGIIYFDQNQWGGFANVFQGLRTAALLALVTGMRLKINWMSYFDLMDDKIHPLKAGGFIESMRCPLLSRVDSLYIRKDICQRVLFTEDDIQKILLKSENRQRLVSLGLFESLPTDIDVRKLLTYTFFVPKSNLASYSKEFVRNLHKYPSIGVQIRTGGSLASDNEDNVFFSPSTMYRVIDMINKVVTENYIFNYNLFVSTDSQEVLTELKSIFPQLIHTSDDFKIGHTSNLRSSDGSNHGQRALIDLMILSSCDYLIYTEDSSYGRLASVLSHSEKTYYVSHK